MHTDSVRPVHDPAGPGRQGRAPAPRGRRSRRPARIRTSRTTFSVSVGDARQLHLRLSRALPVTEASPGVREDGAMPELPRKAVARTARLAALPLGYAGRNALGLGKRLGGRPAEAVMSEIQQRTAEQLFRTLGELKGGAMKFGQAMSVLEAALPDELVAPYRTELTKLQDSAPPMPTQTVRDQIAADLGAGWRDDLVWLDGGPDRRGQHRPGPPGALERRPRRRGEGAVPRRRGGAAVRPAPAGPARPHDRPAGPRHRGQAADRRAPGPGRRTSSTTPSRRRRSRRSPTPSATTRTSSCPTSSRSATRCWSPSGSRARRRSRRSSATARRRSATTTASSSCGSCSPGPPAPACCTPTRTPGNFRILPNADGSPGRLGVLDYGAVARLPDAGLPAAMGRLIRIAGDREPDELVDRPA